MRCNFDKIPKAFGLALKEKRIEFGITQAALASKAKIKLTAIQGYEAGKREPRVLTIIKIARAFEKSPSFLVRRMDEILQSWSDNDNAS